MPLVRYTFTLTAHTHDDGEERTRLATAETLAMSAPAIAKAVGNITGLHVEQIQIAGQEVAPESPDASALN